MKPLIIPQSATILTLALAAALHAQTDAAKPTAASDPFVKTKAPAAAKPAQEAKPAQAEQVEYENVLHSYEIFTLNQRDYHRIIESGLTSADAYREVESQVKAGKASLENIIAVTTRSGQRAVVEQTDEVRYGTEYGPPAPRDEYPVPTAFQMRQAGTQVEVDPVVSPDHVLTDINFALQSTRLNSFMESHADPSSVLGGQIQPVFESRRINSSVSVLRDQPRFVGTLNRASDTGLDGAEEAGTVHVAFARVRSLAFNKPSAPAVLNPDGAFVLRLSALFYSMDRAQAQRLLDGVANGDALHAGVMNLVQTNAAKLERVLTCVTKSGQRTTCEEVHEMKWSTELDLGAPPEESSNAPRPKPITKSYETRPLGWRMEVDPVLGADASTVEVNIAPEFTRFTGMLAGNDFLEKHVPPQPVFEVHKVTTSITVPAGHHAFLSTFSCPGDTNVNGRQDDGKVWFAFLRADVE